jgi:hypothetical protein
VTAHRGVDDEEQQKEFHREESCKIGGAEAGVSIDFQRKGEKGAS